jgi:hypothetical protein
MLPARMENKSQLTGLEELAVWFQIWAKEKRKPKVTKLTSEHPNDRHDQSVYNFSGIKCSRKVVYRYISYIFQIPIA